MSTEGRLPGDKQQRPGRGCSLAATFQSQAAAGRAEPSLGKLLCFLRHGERDPLPQESTADSERSLHWPCEYLGKAGDCFGTPGRDNLREHELNAWDLELFGVTASVFNGLWDGSLCSRVLCRF